MTKEQIILLSLILVLVVCIVLIIILYLFWHCPFVFPYKYIGFDVTAKRQPAILDYVDQYLISGGFSELQRAFDDMRAWKSECENKICNSIFKKHRMRQYLRILDEQLYVFQFYRLQTRYRQQNYVKSSYKVKVIVNVYRVSYQFIYERFMALKNINFECSISDYNKKEQRSLMTKELRMQIAVRDNFTCQRCGKYMPDAVGLHIDHIVPIAKGGKSVPSNLQVLCSRCNGAKSARFYH